MQPKQPPFLFVCGRDNMTSLKAVWIGSVIRGELLPNRA